MVESGAEYLCHRKRVAAMTYQPKCRSCGRFVGRTVRVERYSPLVVVCQECAKRDEARAQHFPEVTLCGVGSPYEVGPTGV